jgi:hypothetical protein
MWIDPSGDRTVTLDDAGSAIHLAFFVAADGTTINSLRGGGSPPSCSSAPATANAPGSLMLFQVVSIQPSERWTCAMRNASIWPLKDRRCR